jgi:hypothetical protein
MRYNSNISSLPALDFQFKLKLEGMENISYFWMYSDLSSSVFWIEFYDCYIYNEFWGSGGNPSWEASDYVASRGVPRSSQRLRVIQTDILHIFKFFYFHTSDLACVILLRFTCIIRSQKWWLRSPVGKKWNTKHLTTRETGSYPLFVVTPLQ